MELPCLSDKQSAGGAGQSLAVPVVSALLSRQARGFCGCPGADGAERNFDLLVPGLLFPEARMPLESWLWERSPFPALTAGLSWVAAQGRQHSALALSSPPVASRPWRALGPAPGSDRMEDVILWHLTAEPGLG